MRYKFRDVIGLGVEAEVVARIEALSNFIHQIATQTSLLALNATIEVVCATTNDAVRAVLGIIDAIHTVENVSTTVATAIEEQSAATGERAQSMRDLMTQLSASVEALREVLVEVVRTSTHEHTD